ncbi:MAG: threonine synthase [Candidatus Acidiferrales bacterium]
MSECFELQCRECGRKWGNQPRSFCEECFSPLEVTYDYDSLQGPAIRWAIESRPRDLWRYAELLPLTEGFRPTLPIGFTPLLPAERLAAQWNIGGGIGELYIKNDAVCFPSLSFKDRVVALALTAARRFGFDVVACSSTGNLANALAAQAVPQGFKAWVFIPADLEAAKIINSAVYGARIVRIDGNYDQVNRLCSQVAEKLPWGIVNVNLRPYYAEGSKTVGFEIAEQLGWRLPDNIVVPMAGGSLITKIKKAFDELARLRIVPLQHVRFFGAQATGCSPISDAVKRNLERFEPQKPNTIARSLAIGNPADGPYAMRAIRESGGWAEDASDAEIVAGIRTLAETEGVFTETAGGVTVAVAQRLLRQGRIKPHETTVLCITGNGLKTTDAVAKELAAEPAIPPRFAEFEAYLGTTSGAFGDRS